MKKKFIYRGRGGGGSRRGVTPDAVGLELERIWKAHKEQLQPDDIVEAASEPDSPLHPCFEWDDSEAGKKYRLFQARNLIRSVRVILVKGGESRPLFVQVRVDQQQQHYQHVDVLVDKPMEYAAALAELHGKLVALTAAYQEVKDLATKSGTADTQRTAAMAAIVEALMTARSLSSHLQ